MLYKTYYKSPLGKLLLISDEESLKVLEIENSRFYNNYETNEILENGNLEILNKTKVWLDKYFNAQKPSIKDIPLNPEGSEFRQMVWKILCEIPYGETITYGDIAKKINEKTGKKMGGQPVGGAVGHNPIAIIIPCHRVVGADGSLTGYGGGMHNKIKLLKLENANMKNLYDPSKKSSL